VPDQTEHTPGLSFKVQDDLKELVQLIRVSKDRGGFFLIGVSGPLARKIIEEELSTRLKGEFVSKKIQWNPGIKDLIKLFPLDDPPGTLYIVDGIEDSIKKDNGAAVYSLLNMTREFYSRYKKIVIYRLPSDVLYKELQWKAPDFWSFRTVSFNFFLEDDYQVIIKEKVRVELEGYEKDSEKVSFFNNLLVQERKKKKPDRKRIANILKKLGDLYRNTGQPQKGLKYLQEALALHRQLDDKQGEASDLSDIGLIYRELGEMNKALKYIRDALQLSRQVKDKLEESNQLGNLGIIYSEFGQQHEALKYQQEALTLDRQMGNKYGEAADLGNIGLIYRMLGQPDRAREFFQEALELDRQLGFKKEEASDLGNIGLIYIDLGQTQKALMYLQEAWELHRQVGYKQGEAKILGNIGLVYRDLDQPQKALLYLRNSLEIFRKIGDKKNESQISKLITQLQEKETKD
jgi:tetratricopeptide (TPR) repeat protein